MVSAVHSNAPDLEVRQHLLENLVDEEQGKENHPELWLRFAEALGASRQEVEETQLLPGTSRAIETMTSICRGGSYQEGMAALYAYESQIPEVSKTKREGLEAFYGITDENATRFFSVHEKADVWHRQVEREALGRVADTPEARERALEAARRCCDALNRALDGVMRENALVC